jgi:hypothetical protein
MHNQPPIDKPPPSEFNIDRVIEPEHFDEIITAILDAKYSWACVLILRFAGQCPCDYIPERTYRRIAREHLPNSQFTPKKQCGQHGR